MYCVLCGILLHTTNQQGLVCRDCKQAHRGRDRFAGRPIRVRFCFGCSQSYHPSDHSIHHWSCLVGERMTACSEPITIN